MLPVLSIGNLTTGGTGKTPMVQWLCRLLRDQKGLRVALLSRGYGRGDNAVNDEALELELSLPDVPHLQDADRGKSAAIAREEFESECLVLDDAFQHRQIHRDLDVVIIDATNPFGFGYCLPRGLLREPVAQLKRADAVIISRCDQVPPQNVDELEAKLKKWIAADTVVCRSVHRAATLVDCNGNDRSLDWLTQKPILAFAGIGNPASFFKTVTDCGGDIIEKQTFPDHHRYQYQDIEELKDWATRARHPNYVTNNCQIQAIVTTRKDLVKVGLPRLGGIELFALEIRLEFLAGQQELESLIFDRIEPFCDE